MKTCSKCKQEKTEEEFNKRKASKDGLTTRCKVCLAKHRKDFYSRNRSRILKLRKNSTSEEKLKKQIYDKEYNKKNREKKKQQAKIWNNNNKEKVRINQLAWTYTKQFGITREEALRLINEATVCEICGREANASIKCQKFLCLDHDHSSGKIRGFLCNPCNRALGYFQDNPEIIKNAAKYLNKYKEA